MRPGDRAGDDPLGGGLAAWLQFMDAAGIDLALTETPQPWAANDAAQATAPRASAAAVPSAPAAPAQPSLVEPRGVTDARRAAAAAGDMEGLLAALRAFEGCPLSRTATNLCVGDGDPTSSFMLIGEAPGAQEDRQGKPFVGPSGQLLDRMLAAAGRPRATTWITNTVFWRPPGNRPPTAQELATCLPFVERQIELITPKLILFVGSIAVKALLELNQGVTRLRGRKLVYKLGDGTEVPATVMFHPAYLLRRPALKGLAWRDLLQATAMLESA